MRGEGEKFIKKYSNFFLLNFLFKKLNWNLTYKFVFFFFLDVEVILVEYEPTTRFLQVLRKFQVSKLYFSVTENVRQILKLN